MDALGPEVTRVARELKLLFILSFRGETIVQDLGGCSRRSYRFRRT